MSKIVIDARESGTSTGRYIDKLIEHLHLLEPQHTVIILTKAERLEYIASIAPKFIVVETPFKEFTFSEQIGFKRQIDGLQADLVHFPMVQQPVWYKGRVVTTMQDLTTIRFKNPTKNAVVYWIKQRVYRWVNKRVARKSAEILTISEFVKQDIVNFTHISPDKITVTLEAADAIHDTPRPIPVVEGKQFIMYVGRPTPHKNLGRLIEAFAALHKTHPDLYLVLAGKKDANYQLHEEAVRANNIPNVIFTGFIPDSQLRWLYEHCVAYVFPSLSEGFGLPGLEAMSHGAPVVSSDATCLPEVHGDAAQYFDPLDVSDIARKIGEVIDNPALARDLSAKGRFRVKQFSWTRMAQQTLEVYENALRHESDSTER